MRKFIIVLFVILVMFGCKKIQLPSNDNTQPNLSLIINVESIKIIEKDGEEVEKVISKTFTLSPTTALIEKQFEKETKKINVLAVAEDTNGGVKSIKIEHIPIDNEIKEVLSDIKIFESPISNAKVGDMVPTKRALAIEIVGEKDPMPALDDGLRNLPERGVITASASNYYLEPVKTAKFYYTWYGNSLEVRKIE